MNVLRIASLTLRRFMGQPQNLVQVFVLPVLLILLLGALRGGSGDVELGVVMLDDSSLATELLDGLRELDGMEVTTASSEEEVVRRVERGQLDAALIVPAGYEESLEAGASVALRAVTQFGLDLGAVGTAVEAVVAEQSNVIRAARFAEDRAVAPYSDALEMARTWQATLPDVEVAISGAGEPQSVERFEQFDIGAHTQITLFTFLTTLAAASTLVQTRRLGVARRILSTPATVRDIILGEGVGRLGIALFQGLFIMIGSWAIFGANWGSPLGAFLTLLVFALVSSAAAMLLGAVARDEEQVGSLSGLFGMGLAVLGGATFPLVAIKFLNETAWQVAHIAPHAWAIESFEELVTADGGLADIGVFLLILLGYAVVLYSLAVWRLQRVLTT